MKINYTKINYCLLKFEDAILKDRLKDFSSLPNRNYLGGVTRVRESLQYFRNLQYKSL